MLSKKSFGGIYENFLKLLMRSMRSDVRDHIASQKNDHGLSYRHYKASQRRSSPKITIARFLAWFDFRLFRQHRTPGEAGQMALEAPTSTSLFSHWPDRLRHSAIVLLV